MRVQKKGPRYNEAMEIADAVARRLLGIWVPLHETRPSADRLRGLDRVRYVYTIAVSRRKEDAHVVHYREGCRSPHITLSSSA